MVEHHSHSGMAAGHHRDLRQQVGALGDGIEGEALPLEHPHPGGHVGAKHPLAIRLVMDQVADADEFDTVGQSDRFLLAGCRRRPVGTSRPPAPAGGARRAPRPPTSRASVSAMLSDAWTSTTPDTPHASISARISVNV